MRPLRLDRLLRSALSVGLLACVLLATSVAVASATADDLRGEWSYKIECNCNQPTAEGIFVVRHMEGNGSFSGTVQLSFFNGTITGTAVESEVALTMDFPTIPPSGVVSEMPEGKLENNGKTITGATKSGGQSGKLTATKLRSLEEVEKEEEALAKAKKEKEEKEKAEREKAEKEQQAKEAEEKQKAKEKAEQEEKERSAKEAQAAQEAKEKSEREAKAAQEAKEKSEAQAKAAQAAKEQEEREHSAGKSAGQPAVVVGKTFTVSAGSVSLELSNANGYSVSGGLTLTSAATKASGGSSRGKSKHNKRIVLAGGSYTISAHGTKVVKLRLSKSAATELERHKTMRVAVAITTRASGESSIATTALITLKLSSAKHK
jgi:flagellar biosynthesis GTPase FlhF